MVTKFAMFLAFTAIALVGVQAEANVPSALDGRTDLSDSVPSLLINQTPLHDQCDVRSIAKPVFPEVVAPHERSIQDFFLGDFSILDGVQAADSCEVPLPSPEQFINVALL